MRLVVAIAKKRNNGFTRISTHAADGKRAPMLLKTTLEKPKLPLFDAHIACIKMDFKNRWGGQRKMFLFKSPACVRACAIINFTASPDRKILKLKVSREIKGVEIAHFWPKNRIY